jgi:large-conductance mechanosensitive channel
MSTTTSIKDKLKNFILKKQPGIFGFMTAYTIGASTNTFLRTFVKNFVVPLLGKIFRIKNLVNLTVGEFHIGPIIGDFIYWVMVALILFLLIEFVFKVTVIDQKTLNDEYYEKNYSKNQLNKILNETGSNVLSSTTTATNKFISSEVRQLEINEKASKKNMNKVLIPQLKQKIRDKSNSIPTGVSSTGETMLFEYKNIKE